MQNATEPSNAQPVEEMTITYAHIEASLSMLGGISGLLTMLPAMMADITDETLDLIDHGVARKEPIDLQLKLPGITYVVHVRG